MIMRLNFMKSKVFFSVDRNNDHEIKSSFFRRSKVSLIFDNIDQENKRTVVRSKVTNKIHYFLLLIS
jgi:hypothetical protein